ncbi:restriction endonuclease subunit S, partial [Bacteroides congonensis]|uniref:restriction endonuclease subunit S n=1 Tax=Bacteroides congonensis TaxID=1871006 RepID=UPI003219358B
YFINSGVTNQGIKGRTSRLARVFPGNTITIDFFGNAYYRPFPYKLATHNHVFSFSGSIIKNEKVGLFLVAQMGYLTKLFAYNEMATIPKLYECAISLPIGADGDIDYNFMESRIRELEESRIRELEAYLSEAGFDNCELSQSETDILSLFKSGKIEWKHFKMGTLYDKLELKNKTFDKRRDTSITPSEKFTIPLVNAKHGDNGIMFYGKSDIFDSSEMTIDIVQNGAIATGNVYAQPQRTGVLWDAYLIKARTHNDTENSLLFMACTIQKSIKSIFSYDKKATWNRVKHESIPLPVDLSGEIDYSLIETFVSAIKKKAIQSLKEFIAQEHQAYTSVAQN